jgi:hypothetical protein
MSSPKDKCFKEATEALKENTNKLKDMDIEFERTWVRDQKGTWSKSNLFWAHLNNAINKTLEIIAGTRSPRTQGRPNPMQVRRPDITINKGNNSLVIDNKFTDKDGNIDPWRSEKGKSGSTQKDDYNEINREHAGDPNAQDVSLDKNKCKCDAKGEPQPVEVWVPDPALQGQPELFFMPSPSGIPSIPPIRVPTIPPIRLPIPIFP